MSTLFTTTPTEAILHAEAFLNQLGMTRIELGLNRVKEILHTLDNPQNQIPVVLVAGTNGKGSVCAVLTSVLTTAGYTVGTYISPHLVCVRERILLNNQWIAEADFTHAINNLKHHLENINWPNDNWPTYFEFLTIMAYQYFAQQPVDVAVMEVGLGGRLDATNVVTKPLLSIITSIGLDHTDRLGNTLSAIAAEKAGIIHAGQRAVVSGTLPDEALAVVNAHAGRQQATLTITDPQRLIGQAALTTDLTQQLTDTHTNQVYETGLIGPYQVYNIATALSAIEVLRTSGIYVTQNQWELGLRQARWPGRFEYKASQQLLFDGCHNPDGFQQLRQGVQMYFTHHPLVWLVALRNNRPIDSLAREIACLPNTISVIATVTPGYEALYHNPETLASALKTFKPELDVMATTNFDAAWTHFIITRLNITGTEAPLGVVCGSLYLVGHVQALFSPTP